MRVAEAIFEKLLLVMTPASLESLRVVLIYNAASEHSGIDTRACTEN